MLTVQKYATFMNKIYLHENLAWYSNFTSWPERNASLFNVEIFGRENWFFLNLIQIFVFIWISRFVWSSKSLGPGSSWSFTRDGKGLVLCRGAVDFFNIALARSPPLAAAAVKVESVVGRQGKMADVGRASIRWEGKEYISSSNRIIISNCGCKILVNLLKRVKLSFKTRFVKKPYLFKSKIWSM